MIRIVAPVAIRPSTETCWNRLEIFSNRQKWSFWAPVITAITIVTRSRNTHWFSVSTRRTDQRLVGSKTRPSGVVNSCCRNTDELLNERFFRCLCCGHHGHDPSLAHDRDAVAQGPVSYTHLTLPTI